MGFQHFRAERFMQSRKPGSFFEGMFRGDDHQKEQRAGAHPLKPLTDDNRAFDPSLQGASGHRASPRCEPSRMVWRRGLYREAVGVSRHPCKRCHLWYIRDSLPVIQKRWGSVRINDARSVRGYAAGRCNVFCLSGYRFQSWIVLVNHCFLMRPNLRQSFRATFKLIEDKAHGDGDFGGHQYEKDQALPPNRATTFFIAPFREMGKCRGRF